MKKSARHANAMDSEAISQLHELESSLSTAYRIFNYSDDPEIIEASILEISALRTKYSRLLQNIKAPGENK